MWDNWKYRENHGYGCPMLRVGAQKLLTTDDGCPMREIVGHGLGMDWAIGGPAPPPRSRFPRRRAPGLVAQLRRPGRGSFPPEIWGYTRRGERKNCLKMRQSRAYGRRRRRGKWMNPRKRPPRPHGEARGRPATPLPAHRENRATGPWGGLPAIWGMANPPAGTRRHGIRMTMACIYVCRWPDGAGVPTVRECPANPAQKARITPGLGFT